MMHLHFNPNVQVIHISEEVISLAVPSSKMEWKNPSPALRYLIGLLLSKGEREEVLADKWLKKSSNLPEFFYFLEAWKQRSLLCWTLYKEKKPFCTLTPFLECPFLLKESPLPPLFQLSRFAYVRNKDGALLCETPLAPVSLELKHAESMSLWFALCKPISFSELKAQFPQTPEKCVEEFVALLHRASFLESEDPALTTWEFHDLLFHTRSRRGRQGGVFGGSFRFLGQLEPSLPLKPVDETSEWISLFKPDIASLIERDIPFSRVLETRASLREYGSRPISQSELGEFLYRSARVKKEKSTQHYGATQRPYPGGGACYELEIYPLVHRCEGIEQGLYYYHPKLHALQLVSSWNREAEEILQSAVRAMAKRETPQIVFLLAARFRRLAWKYESIAYAILLKDVGVLIQTMYLVATAMGLAPCAIGSGNADLFVKMAKTNYYEETTVGEFVLGTRKESL